MLKRLNGLLLLSVFLISGLSAQKDPVLFTVEKTPVHLSEFEYIYNKTNGDKADYSKNSLEEYLDLYVKFKLKVQRAKDMKLDTIKTLQDELAGYRRQLANTYLVDKEVTEKLVKEAYDRTSEDVEISHIMAQLSANPSPADTLQAFQKIHAALAKLKGGAKFEDIAKSDSEDTYSKPNGGRLGFFAAMFREGFYEMESAAYNLKVGAFSNPIRTAVGYHIVRLDSKRPARGEVEVAHILIRNAKDAKDNSPKTKIDNLYKELQPYLKTWPRKTPCMDKRPPREGILVLLLPIVR